MSTPNLKPYPKLKRLAAQGYTVTIVNTGHVVEVQLRPPRGHMIACDTGDTKAKALQKLESQLPSL